MILEIKFYFFSIFWKITVEEFVNQLINKENPAYALILTRSGLGLLCFNLHKFLKELLPLTHIIILFTRNILRMNGWNLTKLGICIDIDKIFEIIMPKIAQIYNRVMALNSSQKFFFLPGSVAQSVMCLATDACLTADPGVASSIPARYHTFVEIDHEIISTVILLPSADLFKKGCCQLQAKVCAQITG